MKYKARLPSLQALNGHKFMSLESVNLSLVPSFVRELFELNKETFKCSLTEALLTGYVGQKRLGKLLSHAYIPETLIAKTYAAFSKGIELTFSTRFADFINAPKTRHYSSCIREGHCNDKTVEDYWLQQPNFGIIYARDKRGEFITRTIARLINHDNKDILVLNPTTYGQQVKFPDAIGNLPCYLPVGASSMFYSLNEHPQEQPLKIAKSKVVSANLPSRCYDDMKKIQARGWNYELYFIKPSLYYKLS